MRQPLRSLAALLLAFGATTNARAGRAEGAQASAGPTAPAFTRESWIALVARYRAEPGEAVATLLRWPPRQVSRVVRLVRGSESDACREECLRLGALMHVEAAMVAHETGKPPLRIAHLDTVAGLLRLLEKAFGPSPFNGRCRLLAGLVQESASWYAQARASFDFAQKQAAQDPGPAFALALLDVDMAAKTGLGCDQAATAGQRRPSAAAALASHRAEEGLRRTLERDPGHEEAHLRLGQLLLVTGRKAEAAVELEWVMDHAQLPADRFVGELLLGSLADGEGRTEAAVARYRTALEIEPNAQVAKVALSDVLNRTGRRERARDLMSELVAAGPVTGDAWLSYCTPDPSRAFWKLLPELRGDVSESGGAGRAKVGSRLSDTSGEATR